MKIISRGELQIMSEKSIPDFIQGLLEEHKGFMKVKDLPESMSFDMKRKLGFMNKKVPVKNIMKILEPLVEDRFIFRKKGSVQYILVPCDPSEFVLSVLTDNPVSPRVIIRTLPFTKQDFISILNELDEAGKIRIILNENYEPRIMLSGRCEEISIKSSGEYTREKFREAFDACDNGKTFVRIPAMRKVLGWPREVFDEMLRNLRDKEELQIYLADETTMTPDEVEDCFVDENGFRMGTVTWDGK